MTDTPPDSTLVVVPCTDLDAAIALYTQQRGFRLDMIMPADAPRIALVSRDGVMLRLDASDAADPSIASQQAAHGFQIISANSADAWNVGRAGMQYRDLIPGRLGGRFIASHIRIPGGGPVPDYVHYHHVRLQLIYCRRGWVRVVYEDQGEPFTMQAGDCVLQPPTIRHRVLESSPGLEVIEIGCPAEHETWRDHATALPSAQLRPERSFGGQRFVRHIAAEADWKPARDARLAYRDTGISNATDGLASVRVLRLRDAAAHDAAPTSQAHNGEFLFLCALEGQCRLLSRALGDHTLDAGDACVIPTGADYALDMDAACEILEVALPAPLT